MSCSICGSREAAETIAELRREIAGHQMVLDSWRADFAQIQKALTMDAKKKKRLRVIMGVMGLLKDTF